MAEEFDILKKVNDFLLSASKTRDFESERYWANVAYGGDFSHWKLDGKALDDEDYNIWTQFVNQICGRFSNSPWHISTQDSAYQEQVNQFENDELYKNNINEAFHDGVVSGRGCIHVFLEDGQPKVEVLDNPTEIYWDNWARNPDFSDANECAIVKAISKHNKWGQEKDSGQISVGKTINLDTGESPVHEITYYCKDGDGFVHGWHIVGEKTEDIGKLPTTIIPVIAFSGYKTFSKQGRNYVGVVQKTWGPQLDLIDIARAERWRRRHQLHTKLLLNESMLNYADNNKKQFMATIEDAVNGDKASACLITAGDTIAQFHDDQYYTGDLDASRLAARTAAEDAVGIKLQGLTPTDKTATEIFVQDQNTDNAICEIWVHAKFACKALGKIILSMLNEGDCPEFELENGPDNASADLKKQKTYFNMLQNCNDEPTRNYLLWKIAEASQFGREVADTLRANLKDYTIVEGSNDIASVMAQNGQLEANMTEALSISDELTIENDQLKNENEELNKQLSDMRAQNELAAREQALKYETKIQELQLKLEQTKADIDNKNEDTVSKKLDNEAKARSLMGV